MNFSEQDKIKDEAAIWVARIHGATHKTDTALPKEVAQPLRKWLSQSSAHRDYFIKMIGTWDAMAALEDLAEILPASDLAFDQEAEASKTSAATGGFGLAAVFRALHNRIAITLSGTAALCTLVLAVWVSTPQQQLYRTGVGEQAIYTLEDGSILTLNTNSEVKIDFSENQRALTLRRGEANFQVSKNPQRPFVVRAGQGAVWAVGTAFNVKHRAGAVDVLVSEGKVKVFSGLSNLDALPHLVEQDAAAVDTAADDDAFPSAVRDVLLLAGEAAQYQQDSLSKTQLEQDRMEKTLAWQTGALLFDGETLEQAMLEISRYTDQHLVIVDASIRQLRVGGRFKTDDIDALLQSLGKSLDLNIEKGEGSQLLFSAKSSKK